MALIMGPRDESPSPRLERMFDIKFQENLAFFK